MVELTGLGITRMTYHIALARSYTVLNVALKKNQHESAQQNMSTMVSLKRDSRSLTPG